jgi:hypothetical protein
LRHQHLPRRSPSDALAGEQQGIREVGANLIEIVQYGGYGSPLSMPAHDQAQEILARSPIDRCQGLIQQNQLGILHDQSSEQDTLDRRSAAANRPSP